MKTAKQFLELTEKLDGKSAKDPGYSLEDWFKDGGWVQTGGKYDGKPCAKQPGQTTKPYCRDPDDRAVLDKEQRNKRAAKKRKEDPNPNRSGEAKMVTQNEAAGEKDTCYKKVKSRYKVWPSAYASGALVKCRKVGASNWGNKSEEVDLFDFVYDFLISENLDEQDVLDIMARVPIEEILEVIEEDSDWRKRNFRPLPDDSIENVGNAATKIMSDIRTQKERPLSRFRPKVRGQIKKGQKQLSNIKHALKMKQGDLDARMKEFDDNVDASNTIKRFQREEFILEYLLSYGYADSYDSAVEIYESMSDEWLQVILEEF